MLVQTAYSLLPNKASCNNGEVLFGAAVSSMSSAVSQLTHVKFLGMTNFSVMRSTYEDRYSPPDFTGARVTQGVGGINKGYTEDLKFFYATTPITKWVAVVVGYESGSSSANPSGLQFSPVIEISIKSMTGSPLAESTTIDYGIRLDSTNSLLLASIAGGNGSGSTSSALLGERVYVHYAESNIEIPTVIPTNTSPVSPRPLYIPSSNRGEIVSINVSCEDCKLRHFTTFDLYEPEQ